MARSKIRSQKQKIQRRIRMTQKQLKALEEKAKDIAETGKTAAQTKLAMAIGESDFTQKHGSQLVDEIGVKKTNKNAYVVYAPITRDNEIKYEMYFAEYGAGLGADTAEHKPGGAIKLDYTPTGNATALGWNYPVEPYVRIDKLGRKREKHYKFTNTSKAVAYMWTARQVMKTRMKEEITACEKKMGFKFKTSIKRPRG